MQSFWQTTQQQWFSNIHKDLLAGLVVALALIPEAIAFSIIAGVDPKVGLYASFCIAIVTAIVGGRPAMISAATGAMALLMVNLVKDHGLQYLLAATLLTGVFQIVAGIFKLGDLLKFVSRSVTIGFVNALAILIFLAQLPEFKGTGWPMYAMVAAGLAIIYLLPLLTKAVPSPLVCIIVLTAFALITGLDLRTVGDMGELPTTLPTFFLPDVPLNLETLWIILPYSLPLAVVGLLESLMTASIVDDLTDTDSQKNRECSGQGIANIVAGFFGGMAGCAMIGQTVINVQSGGRGRLSTFVAGLFLMLLLVLVGDWVAKIPMAALVAVMIMVSIGTFNWASLKNLRTHPKSSSMVMIATVLVVVFTHNLALGVFVGVLMSALTFARKVAQIVDVTSTLDEPTRTRTYLVRGQLFFVSASSFAKSFDFREVLNKVVIDVSQAHIWDITAITALDKIVLKFRREGTEVVLQGLNDASATLVDRLAIHDKPGALDKLLSH
ncbi:SulP family inorganic anion transporter [Phragmitibacter flavus]|uniref:SulP family inorganic anion transporter n=1 Tax=Phragmitibacter flavus TaxID=2576071 RepID=A0A5R8KEX0_9BACT|nr:SulP family inorganic anion transporter [Phragmitibacter flavus]TLD70801.1 SulP family inorganic anion transporter [Phragmitibacter flavus]